LIFNRYLFRDLSIATAFVAVTLAMIILLTESLRFLELIINSGASGSSFWVLTMLAMPRFFEIILPISAMAGTLFIYNRMTMDSELVVMRATGSSPFALSRPAILLALLTTMILFVITMWITPMSLTAMEDLREEIKAQYSTMLFQEGVFNPIGPGLTVYVRDRGLDGELHGLMIHDSRSHLHPPVTIVAKRGELVTSSKGQQVLVYDGTRQSLNLQTGNIDQLDFDRYTIDLPDGGPVRPRWREPEERSMQELLYPPAADLKDRSVKRAFRVELYRRVISPLLAVTFTLISLALLLIGPVDRRGQGRRIAASVLSIIAIEGLYLVAFNAARHSNAGLVLMYSIVLLPAAVSLFFLDRRSESLRQRWLFPVQVRKVPL
jgi:lipopolysaccharide export system permease protein